MIFYAPFRLKDELPFGQYKEDTIEEVIEKDPDYIIWAINNVEDFELDEEATRALREVMDEVPILEF
jgi:hypothetical protein